MMYVFKNNLSVVGWRTIVKFKYKGLERKYKRRETTRKITIYFFLLK
jgi:hypothetical protein